MESMKKDDGDDDDDDEEEEEEQEEMALALRCPPLYPLPEEIQQMERSETVCHYCGVSYLILHEFQQLQTRLAQLEAELQEQRQATRAETAQREALELGRREREDALRLELQRRAEERAERIREGLEGRNEANERHLREEFARRQEAARRAAEEEFAEKSDKREQLLREELGRISEHRLRRQREDVEKSFEEREAALSEALQKATKNSDELRKCLQQLEGRLAGAASELEEAKGILGKEKKRCQALSLVCGSQRRALGETLSLLRTSGTDLAELRGFLGRLGGAWGVCRARILQHSRDTLTEMREELKCSCLELQQMRVEKAHLEQQVMEERGEKEKHLTRHKDSEIKSQQTLSRLSAELKQRDERWLSCQLRCNSLQEQLLAWQQREEQVTRKCAMAEQEVASLRNVLELAQWETEELKRERERVAEAHGRALTKMEQENTQQLTSKLAAALEDQSTQNALHLRKQREELRQEAELERATDGEKNQRLLQQCQRDAGELQRKLEETEAEMRRLREDLQRERRSGEEERKRGEEEGRRRRSEQERHRELQHSRHKEALELSADRAEIQRLADGNAELQEEVAMLQETVRRECQERGELTAALTKAREQLLGWRAAAPRLLPSRPQRTLERQTHPEKEQGHPGGSARIPLNHLVDEVSRGGGSWDGTGARGEVKKREKSGGEGTLPRLRAHGTASKVKHKVSLVTGRRDRV